MRAINLDIFVSIFYISLTTVLLGVAVRNFKDNEERIFLALAFLMLAALLFSFTLLYFRIKENNNHIYIFYIILVVWLIWMPIEIANIAGVTLWVLLVLILGFFFYFRTKKQIQKLIFLLRESFNFFFYVFYLRIELKKKK